MNQKEIDILNLENELLNSRRKLNDLIYACSQENPALKSQNTESRALYNEKIQHLEAELNYINGQLQRMKQGINEAEAVRNYNYGNIQTNAVQMNVIHPESHKYDNINPNTMPGAVVSKESTPTETHHPHTYRAPKDYEKIFGKNFMGIFASVLIFISLVIFATLVLPYLSNTVKMIGLYILSFAILGAGLMLYKKKPENKFYIALIGCGAGALYITLLLSDLYFKVIGDIALYIFILAWAVFVKYLTKFKNLVFTIIGQSGIFISTILGTALCVHEQDVLKFLVLVIFYLTAACVFSNLSRDYLRFLLPNDKSADMQFYYEDNLCSHICKPLNVTVFMLGFSAFIKPSGFELTSIFLLMIFLIFEYYFAYKETCRYGLAFEILTIVNSVLLICLFNVTHVLDKNYSFILMYLISIAVLFYVNHKKTTCTIVSEICCFIMIYLGSYCNPFIRNHLYAYLTIIPFMIYGKLKNIKRYLYAGIVYNVMFFFVLLELSGNYFLKIESLIMIFVVYAVFLYVCRNLELPAFKIAGYLVLCINTMFLEDVVHEFLINYQMTHRIDIEGIGKKSYLISFFVIAVIHLVLNKLEYFGKETSVERMMYGVTALLMAIGCANMYNEIWMLPLILITILLFVSNSKKLLQKHEYAGYYIAFKYTALMICILTSYHVVDYVISICLLLFAITSIITGFYKDTKSFRLYGLVLSMISIIKLIIIDIHYDTTIQNAVSFFVSGVLCFIISFIYHKIDTSLRKKED